MLYNESTGKLKPSVAGFKAWLELQDPKGSYDWSDPLQCVACRYLDSVLGVGHHVYLSSFFENHDMYVMLCQPFPRNYGAVLERLGLWERGFR